MNRLGSRDEAEDAVQSTFLNAHRALQRGVRPESELAWLFKIAHNVCLTRRRSTLRRGRVESASDLDAMQDALPAPSRENAEELIRLPDALAHMPQNQRRAILLREWQGLSYHEIADELGLSQSAVETLIFRARRSLAANLESEPERPAALARARAALDVGSLLAAAKTLIGGGAAAKAAAAAVAVSGVAVVATAPPETPAPEASQPVVSAATQAAAVESGSRTSAVERPRVATTPVKVDAEVGETSATTESVAVATSEQGAAFLSPPAATLDHAAGEPKQERKAAPPAHVQPTQAKAKHGKKKEDNATVSQPAPPAAAQAELPVESASHGRSEGHAAPNDNGAGNGHRK